MLTQKEVICIINHIRITNLSYKGDRKMGEKNKKYFNKSQKGISIITIILIIVLLLIFIGITIVLLNKKGTFGKQKVKNVTTDIEETEYEFAELEKYILGKEKAGRDLEEILDEDDNFSVDPNEKESKVYKNLKIGYINEIESCMKEYIVRYNRNLYKFLAIEENDIVKTLRGSFEKIGTAEGNLGKYVKYKGNTWIVLYDEKNKLELINSEVLGEITLGYKDEGAKKAVTVENEEDLTDEEKIKRGIWSYNNAIETLTNTCKKLTGITTGIRNVGGPAEEENTEKTTLKAGDNYYLEDYAQMRKLGIIVTDSQSDFSSSYWLASRVREKNHVGLRNIEFVYELNENTFVSNSGSSYWTIGVRPVISLTPGILDGRTEKGTIDDPIILND